MHKMQAVLAKIPLLPTDHVRLASPRRVFTLSQTEYVLDRVKWVYDHREPIGGLRLVHGLKTLRFFTGVLEPVSERLSEAYKADFGAEQ